MGADERGWGHPSSQRDNISNMTVHGVSFPGGVNADAEPVMRSLAQEFHNRVEKLHDGWCWGHAYRTIAGSDSWSNHAWGLAIDINAPKHPYGEHNTFGKQDRQRCREIADKHGCRWGGDYDGTPDDMHFEFMGSPAEARRLASETHTDGSGSAMAWFTIDRDNSEGKWRHATEVVQAILNTAEREPGKQEDIKVDGYFGPVTESRVKEYQRWANITVDGIVGPETYTHLLYANIRGDQAPGWG